MTQYYNGTTNNDFQVYYGSEDWVANGNAGNDTLTNSGYVSYYDYYTGEYYEYSVNSTIQGGLGNDNIGGGDAYDALFGGPGNDALGGGYFGDDSLSGDAGNDTLGGNEGRDTMYGGNDRDSLGGGEAEDLMYGGNGNDTMYGGNGNDKMYGDAGNDLIYGSSGDDYLEGGTGSDSIDGSPGNDTLRGFAGLNEKDVLTGNVGSDRFVLGAANGVFYNGDRSNGYAVIKDLSAGDKIQLKSGPNYQLFRGANLVGGGARDTAIATANGDIIGVIQDNTSLVTTIYNNSFLVFV